MTVPDWFEQRWRTCAVRLFGWAGILRPSTARVGPRARPDCWVLYGVLEGALRLKHLGCRLDLADGDAVVVPPGFPYDEFAPLPKRSSIAKALFVVEPGELVDNPLVDLGLPRVVRCARPETLRPTWTALVDARDDVGNPFATRLHLDALLTRFIVDGFAQDAFGGGSSAHPPAWLRLAAAELQQASVRPHFQMRDLVRSTGVSQAHFCRAFKRYYGEPPLRYLRRLRVRFACRLLRGNPEATVEEVAVRCGYLDPVLFSRHFRSLMGASPRQWRRRLREG